MGDIMQTSYYYTNLLLLYKSPTTIQISYYYNYPSVTLTRDFFNIWFSSYRFKLLGDLEGSTGQKATPHRTLHACGFDCKAFHCKVMTQNSR